MSWVFAGYTFPIECEPEHGGAGEWNKTRKVVVHQPINSDVDVLTNFGFTSSKRVVRGLCTQGFRNQFRTFFANLTTGNLVDNESQSQSAQIFEMDFEELVPNRLYRYGITFIAR